MSAASSPPSRAHWLLGILVVAAFYCVAARLGFALAAGNTLEALAGAWLLQRIGFQPALDRVRDVVGLAVLSACASTALSASIGVESELARGSVFWFTLPRAAGAHGFNK